MARPSRMGGALVCLLIIIMDTVAGVLGIEAEMAQSKGKHLRVLFFECREPVHQAYRLGLAAVVLLTVSHAIANLLGGCICICSKEELATSTASKQMATAALVVSWIILLVGFMLLIIGAMANSKSRTSCGFGHRHFLSFGGILCFFHGLFCMAYYVSATTVAVEEGGGGTTRNCVYCGRTMRSIMI